MKQSKHAIVRSCIGVAALGLTWPAFAHATTDVIAKTDDAAPDGNGSLTILGTPVLNDAGQVAFHSHMFGTSGGDADNAGIFRGSGGLLTQIAREGQLAPDGNGTVLFFATDSIGTTGVVLNQAGQVAFHARLTGTTGGTADHDGGFLGAGGAVTQIVRKGQAAPGGNGIFFTTGLPSINSAGQVAFYGPLSETSGGGSDDLGVFLYSNGALSTIIREGDSPPFGNGTFSTFFNGAPFTPAFNNAGQVAVSATLTGTSGGAADNKGIFRASVGITATQIARAGEAVPGGNGTFADFSKPALNNAGQAAFHATLTGTSGGALDNSGIYRGSGGAITTIAREGDAAPDGNGAVIPFAAAPTLNQAGQAAFFSFFSGTSGGSGDDRGILRGSGGPLALIARKGEAAPDGNGRFHFLSVPSLAMNDSGLVAFSDDLAGTSGFGNDDGGIFLSDGIEIVQAAREGGPLAGQNIFSLTFTNGAGSAAEERSGLNNFGQVAYLAVLSFGDRVVARYTPDLHWRNTAGDAWSTPTNWTLSINPAHVHDVFIDPAASLTVAGPTSNTTVKSLQVGGGTGIATLDLQAGKTITVVNGPLHVASTGVLTGDGTIQGSVENDGTVLADNVTVTGGTLLNDALITGDGRVNAAVQNRTTGEIRAAAGKTLHFTGPSNTNFGRIESIGGQIEFDGALTNVGTSANIVARNAILRFDGGLNNQSSVGLSFGTSDVFGDINNTGAIVVSGNSNATFYDDLTNNGELRVSAGSAAVTFGTLSGSGSITGAGTLFIEGDLAPGSSPATITISPDVYAGSSAAFTIELGGMTPAVGHDKIIFDGDVSLGGALEVVLIDLGSGVYQPAMGDVFDVFDFNGTLAGTFATLNLPALSGGLSWDSTDLYAGGTLSVVPEPAGLMLLGLGTALTLRRRGRRGA